MTDEEILELARSCEFLDLRDDGGMLLCCDYELLKFAREIFEMGRESASADGVY